MDNTAKIKAATFRLNGVKARILRDKAKLEVLHYEVERLTLIVKHLSAK